MIINTESEQENKIKEVICSVKVNKNDNFTLTCEIIEELKYSLQSAISPIYDGLLLINFDMYINQNKTIAEKETSVINSRYYFGRSKGINAGAIMAIISSIVVAFASIIWAIYYLRKNQKSNNTNESEVIKVNH